MTRTPPITDAEWEVMNVLWEQSPCTALEVAEALSRHPKTVKTLLGRLARKNVLRYREEGNRYVYSPAIPRQRYVRDESASFIDRVFGGETTPALVHFVRSSRMTQEEIDELRRILDKKADEKAEAKS
ncbi:MAG TPA: BlaI/MecI/CopY family transcriptional regulator [Thermoanaerobaculia bacterium]|nr:BlaI/MecI/CopY family transcriptional regulator [Thermoanaerobaculia bacterium]